MNRLPAYLTFILFIGIIYNVSSQTFFDLVIDTHCDSLKSEEEKMTGTLGLYATVLNPSINQNKDTLLAVIPYKARQTVSFENEAKNLYNFWLIFIPSDQTESPRSLYIGSPTSEGQAIHLNCYFFYKTYPSFIQQLKNGESLTITSTYFGVTHEEMAIPSYTVLFFKKRDQIYASFSESYHFTHNIEIKPQTNAGESQPDTDKMTLLTDLQIKEVVEMEHQILNYILDDLSPNARAKTSIVFRDQEITSYTSSYYSRMLWEKLQANIHE